MIPVYGFLEGDTLGLLLLASERETVGALAGKLQAAAALRVAPRARVRVHHRGKELPQQLTVAAVGIQALDRIDVVGADE